MNRWIPPRSRPALTVNTVHVWQVFLETLPDPQRCEFSDNEWDRGQRLVIPSAQDRFLKSRAWLRHTLASYLNCQSSDIVFHYRQRGKPCLADERLRFNLSHSGTRVLLAVCIDREVGADIELISGERDLVGLARRYFSPVEQEQLLALAPEDQLRGFYHCWTRKEAFIKALGDGLAYPIDRFSVSVNPHVPARILEFADDVSPSTRWSLRDIDVGPEYCAAVVVEAPVAELVLIHDNGQPAA
jgi:4'-phosphopantetheinyl transferase